MGSDELALIQSIRKTIGVSPKVAVGIGDDTAVLPPTTHPQLVTVDMLLEGVHFDFTNCTPFDVGWKALAVNLSDIAAMAGTPRAAVVAVALPPRASKEFASELFLGVKAAADAFETAIVGGDTNKSPGGLVISVTVLGEAHCKGPVLRSGAKPGDWLCVTGPLGYSLAGKHLRFTPRVREAQRLAERYDLHAMIDLSDGLGSDLFHITDESACGALLDASKIPIQPPASADNRTPLDHALNDGEDFELLFTLSEQEATELLRAQPLQDLGVTISHIGVMTSDERVLLKTGDNIVPLTRGGFEHRWTGEHLIGNGEG